MMEVFGVVYFFGVYFMIEGNNSYMGGRNINELYGF